MKLMLFFFAFIIVIVLTAPEPNTDIRAFKYTKGQVVSTIIGANEVQVIDVDTFICIGGTCPSKNDWPQTYKVRLPNGKTKIYYEWELQEKPIDK